MTEAAERVEQLDGEFFADPYRYYRQWSERGSVHQVRLPAGTTEWVITGYAAGKAALADPRLRKGVAGADELLARHTGKPMSAAGRLLTTHMLGADPPDHTRLRRLVNKAFTARRVAALRPRVEEISAGLLDAVDGRSEVDLIASFAEPLPITVICELLGVRFADRDDFRGWTKTLLTSTNSRDTRAVAAAAMARYLAGLVQAKRDEPTDDLLGALVQARDADDQLSETELVSTAFLLLVAGHETTVNLIGNGALALLRNPAQLRALQEDPTRVPAAVEEFLRYDSPVNVATLRYTEEPVVIDGVEIPAGQFVHVAIGSANRDPARFPEPDRLDVERTSAGHVAFGHGIHHCVGAALARLEGEVAFTGLLHRFPRLELASEHLEWQPSMRVRGLVSLPVRLG